MACGTDHHRRPDAGQWPGDGHAVGSFGDRQRHVSAAPPWKQGRYTHDPDRGPMKRNRYFIHATAACTLAAFGSAGHAQPVLTAANGPVPGGTIPMAELAG